MNTITRSKKDVARRKMLVALVLLLIYICVSTSRAASFPAEIVLDDLSSEQGRIVTLEDNSTFSSERLYQALGDVNGDGLGDYVQSDLIFTADDSLIRHFLIYGSTDGSALLATLNNVDGNNGSVVESGSTSSIRPAGDINADGLEDWLLNPNRIGEPWVLVYGSVDGYPRVFGSENLPESQRTLIAESDGVFDSSSSELIGIGDFNGDGIDDLLVRQGSFNHDLTVITGRVGGLGLQFSLDDVPSSFKSTFFGDSTKLARLADINADGFDDFAIGWLFSSEVPVVFGNANGLPNLTNLANLDGSNGVRISPGAEYFSANDVNADGIADLLIGRRGGASVVFGQANWPATIDPSSVSLPTGYGVPNLNSDTRVSSAGDINNDGIGDWLFGFAGFDGVDVQSGVAAIVYGSETPAGNIELNELDGTLGFRILGSANRDRIGGSQALLGDANGDGIDDILFGADTRAIAYTLFGRDNNDAPVSPGSVSVVFGPGIIDLQWQASPSSNIIGYNIKRDGILIGTSPAGINRFSDNTALNDIEYRYEITTDTGTGIVSEPAIITTQNTQLRFPEIGGTVYGVNAAEIFWSFDNLSYTVFRDGVPVFEDYARSYFDAQYSLEGHTYFVQTTLPGQFPIMLRSADVHLPLQADELPPQQPINLSFSVYGDNLLELFWDRSTQGTEPIVYEIQRDEEVLGTTSGTSFLDSNIIDRTSGVYYITAIDANGRRARSEPFLINYFLAQAQRLPQQAINVEGRVYSSTAYEVIWERSDVGVTALSYDVYVNDQFVLNTAGNSFFNDGQEPDTRYTITLIPVGTDGTRGRSVDTSLITDGGPLTPSTISALVYGPRTVEVFWDRSSGATVGPLYEVFRNGTLIETLSGISYLDNDLIPGETVFYQVRARFSESVSAFTESVSITTPVE